MKKLFMLAVLISATSAMASVKVSTQVSTYDGGDSVKPMMALNYNKELNKKYLQPHFNFWIGSGIATFEEKDTTWLSVKPEMNWTYKRLTVSPGVHLKYVDPTDAWQSSFYVKAEYRLVD